MATTKLEESVAQNGQRSPHSDFRAWRCKAGFFLCVTMTRSNAPSDASRLVERQTSICTCFPLRMGLYIIRPQPPPRSARMGSSSSSAPLSWNRLNSCVSEAYGTKLSSSTKLSSGTKPSSPTARASSSSLGNCSSENKEHNLHDFQYNHT
jgi:hypothetical protein